VKIRYINIISYTSYQEYMILFLIDFLTSGLKCHVSHELHVVSESKVIHLNFIETDWKINDAGPLRRNIPVIARDDFVPTLIMLGCVGRLDRNVPRKVERILAAYHEQEQ